MYKNQQEQYIDSVHSQDIVPLLDNSSTLLLENSSNGNQFDSLNSYYYEDDPLNISPLCQSHRPIQTVECYTVADETKFVQESNYQTAECEDEPALFLNGALDKLKSGKRKKKDTRKLLVQDEAKKIKRETKGDPLILILIII